ncbi:hypothetical protein BDF19DRAFT_433352 [Syncephalis fuscata]|nr:hypothetical protein BDF19DRAFT_433352 [Syncephalis fuscata]
MYRGGGSLYTPVLDVSVTISRRCRQLNSTRLPAVNQALVSALAELPEVDFSLEEEAIAASNVFKQEQADWQSAENERLQREQAEIRRRAPGLDNTGRILEPLRTSLAAHQMTTAANQDNSVTLSEEDLKALETELSLVSVPAPLLLNPPIHINSSPVVTASTTSVTGPSISSGYPPVNWIPSPSLTPSTSTLPRPFIKHDINGSSPSSHGHLLSYESHSLQTSPHINPVDALSQQLMSVHLPSTAINTHTNSTTTTTTSSSSYSMLLMGSSSIAKSPLLSGSIGTVTVAPPPVVSHTTVDGSVYTSGVVPPPTFQTQSQQQQQQEFTWMPQPTQLLMTRSTSDDMKHHAAHQSIQHDHQPTYLNRFGHRPSLSAHTSPAIDPFAPLRYERIDEDSSDSHHYNKTKTTTNSNYDPLRYFHERSQSDSISFHTTNIHPLAPLPATALIHHEGAPVHDDIPYFFPENTADGPSTSSRGSSPFYFA